MTSFTYILRGHCRVINWPDFNIAVSQRIGRPGERERQGGMAIGWSNQNTENICGLSSLSYGHSLCCP